GVSLRHRGGPVRVQLCLVVGHCAPGEKACQDAVFCTHSAGQSVSHKGLKSNLVESASVLEWTRRESTDPTQVLAVSVNCRRFRGFSECAFPCFRSHFDHADRRLSTPHWILRHPQHGTRTNP